MPSKETEADRPENRGEGEGDSAGNSSMLGIHQNIKRKEEQLRVYSSSSSGWSKRKLAASSSFLSQAKYAWMTESRGKPRRHS
jgi:hypothetical protein